MMGTWATIATSWMSEECTELFVKHFEENLSGKRHLFMTVDKTLAPSTTLIDFSSRIRAIAAEMKPQDHITPIWVSLLCDEAHSPVVVSLEPGKVTVLFASDENRSYLE